MAPTSLDQPLVSPATPEGSSAPVEAAPTPKPRPTSDVSIEIDLGTQRAYLLKKGRKIAETPISSGRTTHLTPRGNFEITQKDLNHFSSLYGKIVDRRTGRVVVSNADTTMPVPPGCVFKPAPMRYFLRFNGAVGTHAGNLPGYPASHGCVRMPADKAKLFYSMAEIGSPVHVFGSTPANRVSRSPRRSQSGTRIARQEPEPRAADAAPVAVVRRGWFPFFWR